MEKKWPWYRILGYAFIAIFFFLVGYLIYYGEWELLRRLAILWFLTNGICAAVAVALVRGHPLSVAAAFVDSARPLVLPRGRVRRAPDGARPLHQVPVDRPLALIFGNERDGLSDAALEGADGTYCLEMHGFTGSFNLSVSAALSVYETAARVRAHLGRDGDLPPERLERLRALWYCLSVKAAGWILEEAGWRP